MPHEHLCFQLLVRHPGNFFRIEILEGLAIPLSLFEDGFPAEARLRPFKNQHFKQQPVIMDRNAPFHVVILVVEVFSGSDPGTAWKIFFGLF